MNVSSLQKKLSFPVGEVMAALLVAQPLLDVLSYFMGQADATWLTTALRTVLLFAVGVYGFSVTENRRAYYVMYGVVGGFWVLHMLSCLRLGYQDPVGDAAEYLKLVQFPLWTLSFVTFFRQRRNLDYRVAGLLGGERGPDFAGDSLCPTPVGAAGVHLRLPRAGGGHWHVWAGLGWPTPRAPF